MQLTEPTPVKQILAAATLSLLGTSQAALAEQGDWDVDAAILYYQETDRVTALEPVISVMRDFGDERSLNMKLTLDTLTGSSASGAVPTNQLQTFTKPSGRGQYTAAAGETPLDDTFRDTRVALTAGWKQPLGDDYRLSVGGNFSNEYDYLSLALNGGLERDFNQRNTTLSAGVSMAFDTIEPEGGIPVPFSAMVLDTGQANFTDLFKQTRQADGSDTKTTIDLLLGWTQVMSPTTLMQFNYSVSSSSGFHTDPFKVVSIVDANDATVLEQRYELRPDSRLKHALFWQTKHFFRGDVIDVSYRYMVDDWKVSSHTVDAKYRWNLNAQQYLEPRIRFYTQEQAEFYRRYLTDAETLPEFMTADYRLGNLDTLTVGLKYGFRLFNSDASIRAEYMKQTSQSNEKAFGVMQGMDLDPDVDAFMVTLGWAI